MKRLFLTAAGLAAVLLSYTQNNDSTGFKSRKLNIEEVNIVSSYYHQKGNNAAVGGGIGSQQLTDYSNTIDVKLVKYDKRQHKHNLSLEVGIDHYSSASMDLIDLKANSSASTTDTRFYPSVAYSVENEKKGTTYSIGSSHSTEYDYKSYGFNASFAAKTKDRSGEFTAKVQTYFDEIKNVLPVELRWSSYLNSMKTFQRNTVAGSFSYSQIINQRLQVMVLADIINQNGYLGLPFYRVYFKDGSVRQEHLPSNRLKLPVALRASYFPGDRIIIKGYYRYYRDNWGINSHTANLEVPIKISPFVSISPFYRFYSQTASKYFAGFQQHAVTDDFYTSNYDLSRFTSNFIGAGVRLAPPKGILGIIHFSSAEIRYGHYTKNIDMNANIITLHLGFK
jgi:hypothetical protein